MTEGNNVGQAVNASTVGPEVLENFWNLASTDEEIRIDAAQTLLEELLKSQKEVGDSFTENGHSSLKTLPKPYKQADIDQTLSQSCSPLTVYTLKRLIKGLASGRQSARQGFSLALTSMLEKMPNISSEMILALIEINLQATKSMSGSEARDVLLGQLFGLSALFKSRKLPSEVAIQIAEKLINMMNTKAYLREASACAFCDLLEHSGKEAKTKIFLQVQGIKDILHGDRDNPTPEALLIALHCWEGKHSKQLIKDCGLIPNTGQNLPKGFFQSETPEIKSHPWEAADAFFSKEHFEKIKGALKASSSSHPRMHKVLLYVLSLLIPGFTANKVDEAKAVEKGKPKSKHIEIFWREFVEAELLPSSHERKVLAIQLFNVLLPLLEADLVPVVFSSTFSSFLTTNLNKKEAMCHQSAKKVIGRVKTFIEETKDQDLKAAFAVALQRQPGGSLNKELKGKGGAGILQGMDTESLNQYLLHLKKVFEGKETSELAHTGVEERSEDNDSVLESRRKWALEQLSGLCALPQISSSVQASIMQYLISISFFEDIQDVSESIRRLCASRLITILDSAGKARRNEGTETKRSNEVQHERRGENNLLKKAVQFLSTERNDKKLVIELSEPIQESLAALHTVEIHAAKHYSKLSSQIEDEESKQKSFKELALLQLVRWLQIYIIGDAENIEIDLANELASIYQSALGKTSKKRKSLDSEEGEWQDRLVDVLLSLSAYSSAQLPSVPLRDSVEATFKAFAEDLTQTGLEDLVRVIAKPYNSAADENEEILDSEESDIESDEENEEEEESEEDKEKEVQKNEESDQEMTDILEERNGSKHDAGKESTSDSESEEEGMTDEQMFHMDKMLAAVLRTQKDAKSSSKQTKQALQNFKLRALSLLEIYSKSVPQSILTPAILGSLVKAALSESRPNGSKAVYERLCGVITKLSRSKPSESQCYKVAPDTLQDNILGVHIASAKSKEKALGNCSENALHYLLNIAISARGEALKSALQACEQIQDNFFKRRDLRVPSKLMMDIVRRHVGVSEKLLPGLIENLHSARTPYLQIQAAEMLTVYLKAEKEVSSSLLQTIINATSIVVDGQQFPSAQKHAEILRFLSNTWEVLAKSCPKDIENATSSGSCRKLSESLTKAHKLAFNGKISNSLAQIGRLIGLKLGSYDSDAPKRQYQVEKSNTDLKQSKNKQKNKQTQKKGQPKDRTKVETSMLASEPKDQDSNKKKKQKKVKGENNQKEGEEQKPQILNGIVIEDPLVETNEATSAGKDTLMNEEKEKEKKKKKKKKKLKSKNK